MPQTVTKDKLSASTNGKNIKVAASASPGTDIHVAVTGTTSFDEIWLWCYNSDSVTRTLTIQWGGTTTPDDDTKVDIPAGQGRNLIIDGKLLNNGLTVKAYGSAANILIIDGFVNKIV